jgi:hypothetical protein
MRLLPILISSSLLSIPLLSQAETHGKPVHHEATSPAADYGQFVDEDSASHPEGKSSTGHGKAVASTDSVARAKVSPKPALPAPDKKRVAVTKPAPDHAQPGSHAQAPAKSPPGKEGHNQAVPSTQEALKPEVHDKSAHQEMHEDAHKDAGPKEKPATNPGHAEKAEAKSEQNGEKAEHPKDAHAEGAAQGTAHGKPEHGVQAAKEIAPPKYGHGEEHAKEDSHGKEAHADAAPKEKAQGKQEHGSEGDSHETTPHTTAKPDTAFMRASDWDRGNAEILSYGVKWNGKDGESDAQGKLVTERMYLHADGSADRKAAGKGDAEILNSVLACSGKDGSVPFSVQTTVKLSRRESLRLLAQDQSLQAWPGVTHRSLDCRTMPPRLRVLSSGGEAKRDTALSRWPVYTEEMLFTYMRAVPQRAGYHEEIWLQDWGGEGRLDPQPRFAEINVHSRNSEIRDVDAWYITVDREDGRRSEFWVSSSGLHPVVRATLADHSVWTLQGLAREKYWSW